MTAESADETNSKLSVTCDLTSDRKKEKETCFSKICLISLTGKIWKAEKQKCPEWKREREQRNQWRFWRKFQQYKGRTGWTRNEPETDRWWVQHRREHQSSGKSSRGGLKMKWCFSTTTPPQKKLKIYIHYYFDWTLVWFLQFVCVWAESTLLISSPYNSVPRPKKNPRTKLKNIYITGTSGWLSFCPCDTNPYRQMPK